MARETGERVLDNHRHLLLNWLQSVMTAYRCPNNAVQ